MLQSKTTCRYIDALNTRSLRCSFLYCFVQFVYNLFDKKRNDSLVLNKEITVSVPSLFEFILVVDVSAIFILQSRCNPYRIYQIPCHLLYHVQQYKKSVLGTLQEADNYLK
jgi:hypothetical protein